MGFFLKYSGANIHRIEGKRFLPGLNEVSPEEYGRLKAGAGFQSLLDKGVLRWQGQSPDEAKGGQGKENPLADAKPYEAKEVIAETIDKRVLSSLKGKEKRPEVIAAIDEQLEKIEPKDSDFGGPVGRKNKGK